MSSSFPARFLAVLLALSAGGSAAARRVGPSEAASAPRSAPAQDRQAEFQKKFDEARKLGVRSEIEKVVKQFEQEAIVRAVDLCERIASRPSDALYEELDVLRLGWKGAFGTGFVDNHFGYVDTLQPTLKDPRAKLVRRLNELALLIVEQRTKRERAVLDSIAAELETCAQRLDEIGDLYMGSAAWLLVAECNDDELRGRDASFAKALDAYKTPAAPRGALDLRDFYYDNARQRAAKLEALLGTAGPAPGPGSGAGGAAVPSTAGSSGAAIRIEMAFEVLPDPERIERPSWSADVEYASWSSTYLTTKGSSAGIASLAGSPLKILRTGPAEVQLDFDGDGKPDAPLPLMGKIVPVEVRLGTGDDERPWAFLAITGQEKDRYQGIELNMAPADTGMSIYIAPAAAMNGVLGDVPLRVLDDNMDGVYGSPPSAWAYIGMTSGFSQWEFDALVVGSEKRARPYSEHVDVAGQWYRLEPERGGKTLTATPLQVEVGAVKLDAKGVAPDYLILHGLTEPWTSTYIDVAAGGAKGTAVPAGRWELFFGLVRKGKKRELQKVCILPGARTAPIDVEPGKLSVLRIGAPYAFDFVAAASGSKLVVTGRSVCVTGAAGERYERTWGCVPRPEVAWRKQGSKRGSKPERMPYAPDQDAITAANNDYSVCWKPWDLELEIEEGLEVEVQLVDQKNKFFGAIESPWQ